jgi:hypothetical protein
MNAETIDPRDIFHGGVTILDRAMRPAGFRFEAVRAGHYPCGRYWRGRRVLEFHVSSSLGLVSQQMDGLAVMHDDWMRALLGPEGGAYPLHSDDPLDCFYALHKDLARHCGDFLRGTGERWRDVAERALQDPRRFTMTLEFLQLEDARREARRAFADRQFAKVVSLYTPIETLLMPAERRRLDIARGRVEAGTVDGW